MNETRLKRYIFKIRGGKTLKDIKIVFFLDIVYIETVINDNLQDKFCYILITSLT